MVLKRDVFYIGETGDNMQRWDGIDGFRWKLLKGLNEDGVIRAVVMSGVQ
jgi:hypothetical protein